MLRQGGDEGSFVLPDIPLRTITLFTPPVQAGADGVAAIPLELPDFNGQVRLMAVSWQGKPDRRREHRRDRARSVGGGGAAAAFPGPGGCGAAGNAAAQPRSPPGEAVGGSASRDRWRSADPTGWQ